MRVSRSGAGLAAGVGLLLAGTTGCTRAQQAEAPDAAVTMAAPSAARGDYLVRIGGCDDCHSPKVMTEQGPVIDEQRRLSGHPAAIEVPPVPEGVLTPDGWMAMTTGSTTAWAGPWGISYTANLTPDATGIGTWTEEQFIGALRTGRHMGAGRPILPPMPWQMIGQMTDDDLKSVFLYLKSLPPVSNAVPAPVLAGM